MARCFTAVFMMLAFAGSASAGPNPFLGERLLVPYTFCPRGFALMDGSLLPIQQNTALYSLLGIRYGGDGRSTFALPKANTIYTANRVTLRQCIATTGVFPRRP